MNKFYQKLTATSESHDAYWHNLVSLTGRWAEGRKDIAATFAAEYDLSGANTASNVAGGTGTTLAHGTTDVSVDLTATLPSGTYESGTYAATVVLRCE